MSNLETAPAEIECSQAGPADAGEPRADLLAGREVALGRYTVVRRLLPHTHRRMVGAWCFLDHYGPDAVLNTPGMVVPPHPHCGLQTVTWLFDGAVAHTDSLGSRAEIRPGRLNLMTAGHGIAHAEVSPPDRPPQLHGLQLWVALPAREADGPARFEHHEDPPRVDFPDGVTATTVVGSFAGAESPALVHTPLVGVEVVIATAGSASLPLRPDFEYALVAASGTVTASGAAVAPGTLLYLGGGRTSLDLSSPSGATAFLIGGEPFEDELVMWWNFVGRSHEQIVAARDAWASGTQRFGVVDYPGDPLPAPNMPIVRLVPRGRAGRPLDS